MIKMSDKLDELEKEAFKKTIREHGKLGVVQAFIERDSS
jgi:hypothetical protein